MTALNTGHRPRESSPSAPAAPAFAARITSRWCPAGRRIRVERRDSGKAAARKASPELHRNIP
jgi:hypothetical protein